MNGNVKIPAKLSGGGAARPRGGTHDIFGRECATIKSLYRPFLEFLTKKLALFGIFVPNGGLQSMILRAVLRKNGFDFQKIFQKL